MDELEAQLKRYADAAEQRVATTPTAPPNRSRRGKQLAVAATLALIGGSVALFLAAQDTAERIDTSPHDETWIGPAVEPCPRPAEEPLPQHLQLSPLSVGDSKVERTNVGSTTTSEVFTVFVGPDSDDWIEVQVRELDEAESPVRAAQGTSTVPLRVCDPFRADRDRRHVEGILGERPYDRSLTFTVGDRWTVSLRAAPADRSTRTQDDLIAVVAGLAWPAPTVEQTTTTTARGSSDRDCPTDPEVAIEVGSLTVTAVPDGYEPKVPVETEDSGVPVDLGGGSTATLSLVHPDGRIIQVTAFGAESPRQFIADAFAGGGEYEPVNVRRCTRTANGWERLDGLASIGTNGGSTMLAAQEWEYEGYLVISLHGTGRDEILAVAEGLRFGSVP